MEIGKLPHRLHPTPINHNNFSTILDPVHNSSSHFEPTTGELVQDHKSPHINIFSFFDLNQIVDATFDVLFIEEGDYFVEDLEVVVDCLDGFGWLVSLEQLRQAVMVTAEVVNQDIAILTGVADITECIGLATEDVDVAASFIKMEVLDTGLTFLAVQGEFTTTADGDGLSTY